MGAVANDVEVKWRGAQYLSTCLVPIADLRQFPGNARKGDVPKIAQSLRRFGQVRPVLVSAISDDGSLTIVAGHHVTKAAKVLGWTHIAVVPAEFESRDDARDYLLADNQLARLGRYLRVDQMSLMEEVERRGSWEGTGFSPDDLADMRALVTHQTEYVKESELKDHPENYRDHPEDQIEHLMASLSQHGIYRSVVIANDGTVLAGHGILEASRRIGIKRIPVTRMPYGPDDPRALKLVAGDNELDKLGELNDRQLTDLLKQVIEKGDVTSLLGTGYDAQTLANLVLITRRESEIPDHNAAAEWIGLPEFDSPDGKIQLVFTCDSEDDRDELLRTLGETQGMKVRIANKNRATWAIRWPLRVREDLASLRFDLGDEDEGIEVE